MKRGRFSEAADDEVTSKGRSTPTVRPFVGRLLHSPSDYNNKGRVML
jgi:hypothetical protein